jgi:hypothetical protein
MHGFHGFFQYPSQKQEVRYQTSRIPLRLLSTTVVLTRGDAELGIRR